MFYDPKRKTIVDYGSSRACGENHNKASIHAEQNALQFCLKNDRNNRYQIFISRYSRGGSLKKIHCCHSCTKLLEKYNYQDKIYTFDENKKCIPAIISNPKISLAYKIKHGYK